MNTRDNKEKNYPNRIAARIRERLCFVSVKSSLLLEVKVLDFIQLSVLFKLNNVFKDFKD